jgi:hypothetical protein
MSNADKWAITISVLSAVVAVASFVWSIASWQREGPRFRIHALLYREEFLIWIFNSGRLPAQIEHLVLGGRRGGIGGYDLTVVANCPLHLDPGQSARLSIDPADLPVDRRRVADRGWSSLWLLLGSMQQRRAEVLPLPTAHPPTVGWRLAPRGTQLSRYRPLLASAAFVVAAGPAREPMSVRVSGAVVLIFLLVAGWFVRAGRFRSRRQNVEFWTVLLAAALAIVVAAHSSNSDLVTWIVDPYLALAIVLAWPGPVGEILSRAASIRRRVVAWRRSLPSRGDRDGSAW